MPVKSIPHKIFHVSFSVEDKIKNYGLDKRKGEIYELRTIGGLLRMYKKWALFI